ERHGTGLRSPAEYRCTAPEVADRNRAIAAQTGDPRAVPELVEHRSSWLVLELDRCVHHPSGLRRNYAVTTRVEPSGAVPGLAVVMLRVIADVEPLPAGQKPQWRGGEKPPPRAPENRDA